jgi:pilus assembly protein Flp/PilA
MSEWIKRLWQGEEGATMVEYGVMVALIAAVCVAIVTTLGTNVQSAFTTTSNAIKPAS